MLTRLRSCPAVATIMMLALAAAGCGDGPKACTEIGCSDGVFLTIVGPSDQPVTSFSGEVTIGDKTIALSCTSTNSGGDDYFCGGNLLEITVTEGDAVTVDLTSTDDPSLGFSGTIPLQFEEVQPNGEGCDPTCRQANATVTLVSE